VSVSVGVRRFNTCNRSWILHRTCFLIFLRSIFLADSDADAALSTGFRREQLFNNSLA